MSAAEFSDPQLVALYDLVNEPEPQLGFYAAVAAELGAPSVVDLGCGTGRITCELTRREIEATGIDPAPAMLAVAQARCSEVRWILGGPALIPRGSFDLALMTGYVAQFFLADEEWDGALRALRRGLRAHGWLAFDTRNPAAQAWESWGGQTPRVIEHVDLGRFEVGSIAEAAGSGVVRYTNHYRFSTGEELTSTGLLRFRTPGQLEATLTAAGFTVEEIYGDWDRSAVGSTSPELIVLARARAEPPSSYVPGSVTKSMRRSTELTSGVSTSS